jgi:hypothetical protein
MQRFLIVVMATLLVTPIARASGGDARAASEELIARGVDARLREHHEEALDFFRKAHTLSPSARTFAQMGLAELSLHKWLEAEDHLATALQRHDVPWVEDLRVRGVLEKSLEKARGHIGALVVHGTPGIEILVDGRSIGTLPMKTPLRIAEGKARVAGSAAGRRATEIEVNVVGGQETMTRLDLAPVVLVPAAPSAPAPTTHVAVPVPATAAPPSVRLESSSPTRWQTWTGAGLLVLSAGAIATGAVLLKIDGGGTCSDPPGYQCPELWKTKKLGIVSLVGAAVGTAAAITLIVWRPDGTSRSTALVPTGVAFAARF